MSENQSTSGAPSSEASGQETVTQENPSGSVNQVSYESHAKLLSEKKALQAKFQEMNDKLQALQGQQLQSEGKKDEYIKHLESQLTEERETRINDRATFANRTLSERIISKAHSMGCVDSDAILKLADLERVSIGEDLSIDENSVNLMLDDMKKSRPYLFKSQVVQPKDGVPVATMQKLEQQSVPPKKTENLTEAEFQAQFREGLKKALEADPI